MKLEELIYQAVTADANMALLLTTYGNQPALFEMRAPADTADGWGASQYPRMEYLVDRAEVPERRVEGTAEFIILCLTSGSVAPEDIEANLRALLDGAVFHPDNEPVTALRWARSDPFEAQANQKGDDMLIGYTVLFDLLAFPAQTTTSPDPVAALNTWAGNVFPELQVDPAVWAPTDQNPAIYWRLAGLQIAQQTAAVAWLEATIVGHILAPTPAGRLPWLKKIVERLATDRSTTMDDGSPLLFQTVAADSQADHLRAGQIRLTARYGVLVSKAAAELLNQAHISGDIGENYTGT
jgi:hypothetical protein